MNTYLFLDWANSNAPAITALATVLLVLITAVYVVVTYLLVREQRAQGQMPDVTVEWADLESPLADLELRNVGSGAAIQLTLLKGPGDGVAVDEGPLGVRQTLLPGEKTLWRVRPPNGAREFESGELPLTMSYLNNNRDKVLFEVLVIQLIEEDGGVKPDFTGTVCRWWTRSQIRGLTIKSLPSRKRFGFRWRTKRVTLSLLLLDDEVRAALKENLSALARRLGTVSQQAESVQRHI